MHEYKVSWREIWFEWTPGQAFLFLARMTERYKTTKKTPKAKTLNQDELKDSPWMKG